MPKLSKVISTVLLGIAATIFLFASPVMAQEPVLEITDIRLSNHLGNAFVVSWRTNKPTTSNQLMMGKDRFNLDTVINDTLEAPSSIHFAQVTFLDLNTTYFYKVRSDGLEKAVSSTGVDSVITRQQVRPGTSVNFPGYVKDEITGDPIENVLVRSYIRWTQSGGIVDSSSWYASLTNEQGYFNFDLANYRKYRNGILGLPTYIPGQTWMFLEILGPVQEKRDSVLLTVARTPGAYQDLGTFEIIRQEAGANRCLITATGPVLANGTSASVVEVIVLGENDVPIANVEVKLKALNENGIKYLQPQQKTDVNGYTWGLVFSTVAQPKGIVARNMTAPDSAVFQDTLGRVDAMATIDFLQTGAPDYTLDKTAPFIYFTTDYPNTQDQNGPYKITASVVDNFTFDARLVWTTRTSIFEDTLDMELTVGTNNYVADIAGQPFNSVVQYFVLAVDSMGNRASKPDSIHSNRFVPPFRFEVLSDTSIRPQMSISNTTDALSRLYDANLPVNIDTWIIASKGVHSAVIKWRNLLEGDIFKEIQLSHYGAHYWGSIPPQLEGSTVEYFIQVTDSGGESETDPQSAPRDLFSFEVLSQASLGEVSFADTTGFLGTSDVRRSRYAAIVDLDGDGTQEVVVANYGEANSAYSYYYGLGLQDITAQSFGVQQPLNSTHIAVADFNGDDYPDIVFANDGGQNSLFINNTRGMFENYATKIYGPTNETYMPVETWGSQCLAADDFDGDGDIDLFVANKGASGGEQNRLLFNDSLGILRDVTHLKVHNAPELSQTVWAIAGDLDNDNRVDIVVINRAQKHHWLRNTGAGVFEYRLINTESAATATSGDLGDVDGDGDLDLVVGVNNTTQNELYINNGNGGFTKDTGGRLPLESDDTYGVKLFDANADGYLDLYYINDNAANRLLLNNGLGSFYEAPTGMIPRWTSSSRYAAVGDFNQDNRVDLYICEYNRKNSVIQSRNFSSDPGTRPFDFDLVSPAAGDTINTTTATFYWRSSSTADTTEVLHYDFYLSLDSLFSSSGIVNDGPIAGLTDTALTFPGLQDNTRYWWKVLAKSSSGAAVQSRQVNGFFVDESYVGGPEFSVIVSRNPVFPGYVTFYIVPSETLLGTPTVKVNNVAIAVTRVGTTNIFRAQYATRSSFLLYISGVNAGGMQGEYTKAYASVLASALSSVVSVPEGNAWLMFDGALTAGELQILAESNHKIKTEKLKTALRQAGGLAGLSAEDLEARFEGESYTFSALQDNLQGEATVTIKATGDEPEGPISVCILKSGVWQPLETIFDPAAGTYSARTSCLGTFALRATAAGSAVLPKAGSFFMGQNSPNPFNPATSITYSVPGPEPAYRLTLRIYTLRGQLVRTLVNGIKAPGTYSVQWNGQSESGSDLPSGVYFYRLSAPGKTITRKMVLLR